MTTDPNSTTGASRAQPESFRARALGAAITANDLNKSLAWYTDVVGFTIDQKYEREGKVVGVSLKAGDVGIILNQDDGAKGVGRVKGQGMAFQFTTAQKVDDIANRIKAAGGKLDMDPADMPWGARIFTLTDPDGFKIVISTERA
jgi:lactoylglutathione lyase